MRRLRIRCTASRVALRGVESDFDFDFWLKHQNKVFFAIITIVWYNGSLDFETVGIFVTGHLVLRDSQIFVTVKIYTLVSGCQAHTIQIVRAHARDLPMAAAGQAYGLAPVCDRYQRASESPLPGAALLDAMCVEWKRVRESYS